MLDLAISADAATVIPHFAREKIADVIEEIKPLLVKHWQEIAHYPDIALKPDYSRYLQLELAGILRIYTVRVGRRLVGYGLYGVQRALHYSESLQAMQDILWLDPDYRRGRVGWKLIEFADQQLKAEGVQVVMQHVKAAHPALGALLTRMRYRLVDNIFARRLD